MLIVRKQFKKLLLLVYNLNKFKVFWLIISCNFKKMFGFSCLEIGMTRENFQPRDWSIKSRVGMRGALEFEGRFIVECGRKTRSY